MPRARRTSIDVDEDALAQMSDLDQDPAPAVPAPRRGPGRPRKLVPSGTRGPGRIPARTSSGKVMSKAEMRNRVLAEVTTYLSLSVAAWSLRDPECAGVAEAAIPEVAERTVALLSRNESVLAAVAKSGVVGDVIGLLSALLPVARAIWAAHGPAGTGHEESEPVNAERYPAYSR